MHYLLAIINKYSSGKWDRSD